jgi:hypothetical protein
MDANSIYTIIITAITVLGSASAWRFYDKRALTREKAENFMKDDCRDRILKLEALLENSSKEKDTMREQILKLTGLVAELSVKVSFLEKENNELLKESRLKRKG